MLTTTSVCSRESLAQVRAGVPRMPHAIPVEDQEEAGTLQSSGRGALRLTSQRGQTSFPFHRGGN